MFLSVHQNRNIPSTRQRRNRYRMIAHPAHCNSSAPPKSHCTSSGNFPRPRAGSMGVSCRTGTRAPASFPSPSFRQPKPAWLKTESQRKPRLFSCPSYTPPSGCQEEFANWFHINAPRIRPEAGSERRISAAPGAHPPSMATGRKKLLPGVSGSWRCARSPPGGRAPERIDARPGPAGIRVRPARFPPSASPFPGPEIRAAESRICGKCPSIL